MSARAIAVAVAILTVSAGVFRAVSGSRSDDLLLVHSWLVYWLTQGANPYTGATAVNYPPHAFIVLAPLGLMSKSVVPFVWAAAQVAIAPLAAWWLVRTWPLPKGDRVLVTALITSWNAVMTGIWMGQFTLLAVLFGLQGLRTMPSPWITGAWLAASAIKPHIGVVFLGWALARGQFRALAAAAVWGLAGLLLMAAWAHTSPIVIVQTWLDVVGKMFGAASPQRGVTEWWGLFEGWITPSLAGTLRAAGAAAGAVVLAVTLYRTRSEDSTGRVALAVIAVWSLATLFHRRYDLILLAPAFLCLWSAARQNEDGSPSWWIGIAFLHLALVIDIPWAWQVYYGPGAVPAGPLAWLAVQFDRIVILGVAVALWLSVRHRSDSRQPTSGSAYLPDAERPAAPSGPPPPAPC